MNKIPSRSTPDHDAAIRDALVVALEDVLRYCVTVNGFKDVSKGRTEEQQFAYDQARAALAAAKTAA